jgi:hypothetical protein
MPTIFKGEVVWLVLVRGILELGFMRGSNPTHRDKTAMDGAPGQEKEPLEGDVVVGDALVGVVGGGGGRGGRA